jgi:hypothetical protein
MKTKFLTLACYLLAGLVSIAANTNNTIQQKTILTSQFTRDAATNETAAQWRTKIAVYSTNEVNAAFAGTTAYINAQDNTIIDEVAGNDTNIRNDVASYLNQLRTSVVITNLWSSNIFVTNIVSSTNYTKTGFITNLNTSIGNISTGNVTNLNTVGATFSGGVTNSALAGATTTGTTNLVSVNSSGVLGIFPYTTTTKCKFNGASTNLMTPAAASSNLYNSHNVASVQRNYAGNYTITFSNAFANTNYIVSATEELNHANSLRCRIITPTTGVLTLAYTNFSSGSADPVFLYLSIIP